MKIVITGGTGLVGQHLTRLLLAKGHEVAHLSRTKRSGEIATYAWDIENQFIEEGALSDVDALIHLAGSGIADGRWTAKRKRIIFDSRIKSTELLLNTLKETDNRIKNVVAASAIGFYGMETGDALQMEDSPAGNDFLAEVVTQWEKSSAQFRDLGIKTTQLRIGIVLDKKGGALGKMTTPLKLGLGSPLGSGNQWMSWIHIDDLCKMITFSMEQGLDDVYNAVAPNPATNADLTKALAQSLGKPLFMPNVPGFALRLALGEMASLVLGGNNVSSEKISKSRFQFDYPHLDGALKNIFG